MDGPLYPSAALGFRVWHLENDTACSLIQGIPWRTGANRATCSWHRDTHHTAPDLGCECGFHCYHDFDRARVHAASYFFQALPLVGVIAGAGSAAVHHTGFRIERAQILGFVVLSAMRHPSRKLVRSAAGAYGVPCFDEVSSLIAHGMGHAAPVPLELRPEEDEGERFLGPETLAAL